MPPNVTQPATVTVTQPTGMNNGTSSSFLEAFIIINDNDNYAVHFIFLYLLKLLFIIWTDSFFLYKNVDHSL